MAWTDERVALLEKLWTEGRSAAEIAKELSEGVTRNAVIGKAHRMGLSGRPSPIKKKKNETVKTTPRKKSVSKAAPKSVAAPVSKMPLKTAAASGMVEPLTESTEGMAAKSNSPDGGVSMLELTGKMCKWPIGDPRNADFHFCGAFSPPGFTYCQVHADLAYQTSSSKKRGAK